MNMCVWCVPVVWCQFYLFDALEAMPTKYGGAIYFIFSESIGIEQQMAL